MKMKKLMASLAIALSQLAVAAAPNDHFACRTVQFFGRLQVEVERTQDAVRVLVQGLDASRAASSLGLTKPGVAARSLEVNFQPEWCSISSENIAVVSCAVPSSEFPRPTLKVRAFDHKGAVVASGELSVYDLTIERTRRISATAKGDVEHETNELNAFLISQSDNTRRAYLRLPYELTECARK
jgi:hypothetical protein